MSARLRGAHETKTARAILESRLAKPNPCPAKRKVRSYRESQSVLGLDFFEFSFDSPLNSFALMPQMSQCPIGTHPFWTSSLPIAQVISGIQPQLQRFGQELFQRYSFLRCRTLGATKKGFG